MKMSKQVSSTNGQIIIISLLLFSLIFCLIGMTLDVGWIIYNKNSLQNAADICVLSSAQHLPTNPSLAYTKGISMFEKNYNDKTSTYSISFTNSNFDVEFHYIKNIPLFFSSVLGFRNFEITGTSRAGIQSLYKPSAIIPLGISSTTLLSYDTTVTLRGKDTKYESGNFGIVDPTSDGKMQNKQLEDWIINDYKGEKDMPTTGGFIYTTTGMKTGSVNKGIDERIRLRKTTFVAPIVNFSNMDKNKRAPLLGYAAFDVLKSEIIDNETVITGKFKELIVSNDMVHNTSSYYGIKSIHLVK